MNNCPDDAVEGRFRFVAAAAVILLAAGFLVWADLGARKARRLPENVPGGNLVQTVATQEEVYGVYEGLGLSGAFVVHLNRYFNLVPYLPSESALPARFPIPIHADLERWYEEGLDSHNWLFIAAQTGMVRRLVTVLPDGVYDGLREYFAANPEFRVLPGQVDGYMFDLQRTVVRPSMLPRTEEAVVLNVDAGFFDEGTDPARLVDLIRERCPDVRLLVLVESHDEPEVTDAMRAALRTFARIWRGTA